MARKITTSTVKAPAGKAPDRRITAWSFSRYNDWLRCPAYAGYKHVDRRKEPSNPAAARGEALHLAAQAYVEGGAKKLDPVFAGFEKDFTALRKVKAICEEQWAFTDKWDQTGWFDKDAWLRVKMDAHFVDKKGVLAPINMLMLVDHKSGKVKEDEHQLQSDLYALVGLMRYPHVEGVVSEFWYCDQKSKMRIEYDRAELATLEKDWARRIKPMFADRRFAPRPSVACRWCPFSAAKGGPCQF